MSPLDDIDSDGSVVIAPMASWDIATYDFSFTCACQSAVTLSDIPGATTQTQPVYLTPGSWTVTANAKNTAGDIVGVGSTTVTVSAGHSTTASLAILSLSGNGTLTLAVDMSDLPISAPALAGSLTPAGTGNTVTLSFAMAEGSASYSGSIAAGSYLLQLDLWDGTQKLATFADTVLVAADISTVDSLSCKPKDGSVVVQLVDQITRAIAITLCGAQATLKVGTTMTVTANPAISVDSYQWYLDGQPISGATTKRLTVGSGLAMGDYGLTVVVKKSSVYSSKSVSFTVTASSTN